jgi:hypothetical protein
MKFSSLRPNSLLTVPSLAICIATLSLLSACSSGGEKVDDGSSSLSIVQSSQNGSTREQGRALFSFALPAGANAFQLAGLSGDGTLVPKSLKNAVGQELLTQSSQGTAQAQRSSATPSTLNFPYGTGAISSGNYQVSYQLSTQEPGKDVSLVLLSKSDSDLRNGTLKVNFIGIGAAIDSEEIRNDLEGVIEVVKVLYSRAGISIDPQWYSFAGPTEVPDPRTGDSSYDAISAAVRPYAVNVVFAGKVKGLKGDDQYGVPGAAPGPSIPSSRSAIVIDILKVTGGDGQFQVDGDGDSDRPSGHNDEIRLCAEEIARDIGLFLGLENVVEFKGNEVIGTDSLADTESCITEIQCREQGEARNNIMFPRPLRLSSEDNQDNNSDGTSYYAREDFTESQRAVLNSHVLVD